MRHFLPGAVALLALIVACTPAAPPPAPTPTLAKPAILLTPRPTVPPPTATWGNMLGSAQTYLARSWTYALMPGLAITLTVIGRKTGRKLTRPVIAIPAEPGYALVASKAGGPSDPAW